MLLCHVGILERLPAAFVRLPAAFVRLPAAFVRHGCGLRREETEKIESHVL